MHQSTKLSIIINFLYNISRNVQGMKPLADIWSNTLNFEGFFKDVKN